MRIYLILSAFLRMDFYVFSLIFRCFSVEIQPVSFIKPIINKLSPRNSKNMDLIQTEGLIVMNPLHMLRNLEEIETRLMIWLMEEKN